jgi:DHA1 family inner membrane transport protein
MRAGPAAWPAAGFPLAHPLPERARRPEVLGTLVRSVLSQVGIFALYTYLAPFLAQAVGINGSGIAAVLFLFGAGGAVGNLIGGAAADRFRSRRLLATTFGSLAAIFVLLSGAASALPIAMAHLGPLSLGFVAGACELVMLAALRGAPEVPSAHADAFIGAMGGN